MSGGIVNFAKRQSFRYSVLLGTYMLTPSESAALHLLIFVFLFSFYRYMSEFIAQSDALK